MPKDNRFMRGIEIQFVQSTYNIIKKTDSKTLYLSFKFAVPAEKSKLEDGVTIRKELSLILILCSCHIIPVNYSFPKVLFLKQYVVYSNSVMSFLSMSNYTSEGYQSATTPPPKRSQNLFSHIQMIDILFMYIAYKCM
jgi:hypothetical protein